MGSRHVLKVETKGIAEEPGDPCSVGLYLKDLEGLRRSAFSLNLQGN